VDDLFHLSTVEDWAAAGELSDSTRGRTLAEEGYIHCSSAEQVAGVAGRYYADLDAVVLLRIDPELVGSPIVVEDLVGSGEAFPHVYGPIPTAAVREAVTIAPGDIVPGDLAGH
jgi:glutathione S-transferase